MPKELTENGFEQKEVAAMVEVSEKTIGVWVKKYKWKPARKKPAISNITDHAFATDFKQYVMLFAPKQAEKTCLLVDDYLKSLDLK